ARDLPVAAVREQVRLLGAPTVFADQAAVLETEIDLEVGETVKASIQIRGESFDLAAVTAASLRPYISCELPAIASAGPGSAPWQHAALADDVLTTWFGISPAFL